MPIIDLSSSFPAPAVARAAGSNLGAYKNYIHRDALLYPGSEPRAGYVRMIPAYGACEFAVLVHLQQIGLSVEAATAVWKEIVQRQFSVERKPKDDGDEPMSFEEIQRNKAARWTKGSDNQPPATLPSFMNGDVQSGELVAVVIRADKFGRDAQFHVSLRKVTPDTPPEFRNDLPQLFASGGSPRPESVLLLNLNAVIARVFDALSADVDQD